MGIVIYVTLELGGLIATRTLTKRYTCTISVSVNVLYQYQDYIYHQLSTRDLADCRYQKGLLQEHPENNNILLIITHEKMLHLTIINKGTTTEI